MNDIFRNRSISCWLIRFIDKLDARKPDSEDPNYNDENREMVGMRGIGPGGRSIWGMEKLFHDLLKSLLLLRRVFFRHVSLLNQGTIDRSVDSNESASTFVSSSTSSSPSSSPSLKPYIEWYQLRRNAIRWSGPFIKCGATVSADERIGIHLRIWASHIFIIFYF